MLDWAGRYFGTPFKGYRRVTQGDPLSPTILNMGAYAVIRHWVALVVGEEVELERIGKAVQRIAALFCTYDKLLYSPWPARLQGALYFLTGLFNRVGLSTNTKKTVGVTFQPCHMDIRHSEVAYRQRITQ